MMGLCNTSIENCVYGLETYCLRQRGLGLGLGLEPHGLGLGPLGLGLGAQFLGLGLRVLVLTITC